MKRLLKRVFGLADEEILSFSALIVLGFFMGIFSATYSVAGTTLFLNNFNEQSDLPGAFIISGVIGVLSAYLYSYLQKKVAFGKLIIGFSSLIFALVSLVVVRFHFHGDIREVIYFTFVLITPFVTHISLIFWGVFGRMFDVRQSKKIIGNVDSGQLLASMIALFSVPVLLTVLADVQSLILISLGSMAIFLFVILFIVGKGLLKKTKVEELLEKTEENKSISLIFKNKYILSMGAFVLMSMIAVKFVDYSFLNVASAQFEDEKSMAFFLSFFEGAIVVLSFVFQTFFTDKVIENYGLKVSLLITPVILLIFITLSSLIGISLFDNYGPQSPTFLIFFIFIALSRMFSLALKDALDGPTFKLYFMPLDESVRFDAQTKIDGVVNIFAGSVAGAFLFLFDRISWINFLHITFLIIPFGVGWFFMVVKMNEKYRDTLMSTLERMKSKGRKLFSRLFEMSEDSSKYLHLKKESEILRALEFMERVNPLFFEKLATRYQKHRSEQVRNFVRDKLALFEMDGFDVRKATPKHESGKVRDLALAAVENSKRGDHVFFSNEQLGELCRSEKVVDRILGANALKFLCNDENIFLLIELLRDRDLQVKKVALKTASDIGRQETWNVIIELLANEATANHATAAIIKLGEGILPNLENHFHKSTNSPDVLLRIIKIYGQINASRSIEYLFKKLDYPNHAIRKETINALSRASFEVTGFNRVVITTTLKNEVGKTFWNQMALGELSSGEYVEHLRYAMEAEIQQNFDVIFNLLGILYEKKSVELVRQNFESGSNESIAFALELMNIFVDEDLKPFLFPVIDNLSAQERYLKLREEFPRESFNEFQVLQQIIFREKGMLGSWAKVCALYVYGLRDSKITDTIAAQLFNEEALVRHVALWVFKRKDARAFESILKRLKKTNRKKWSDQLELEYLQVDAISEMPVLMTQALKMASFKAFKNVSPEILCHLLQAGDISTTPPQGKTEYGRTGNETVLIVLDGEITLEKGEHPMLALKEGGIFSELSANTAPNMMRAYNTAERNATILLLKQQDVVKLSVFYQELLDAFALYDDSEHNLQVDESLKNVTD